MRKTMMLLFVLSSVFCVLFSFGDQRKSTADSEKTSTLTPQNLMSLPKPGSIHVNKPNYCEMWIMSASYGHFIEWASSNVQGMVKILLMKDPNTVSMVITPGVPDASHSFLWQIPPTVQPGSYYIRIHSVNNPSVYDLSDSFFKIIP
jgi:hypothetical protein